MKVKKRFTATRYTFYGERVSAQCMLFPTQLSKLGQFKVIQCQSS